MPPVQSWYRWEGADLLLNLWVQPRASKDEFVAPRGNSYRMRITAPPLDGKANAHLIRVLARAFGVPQRKVSLESGARTRNKVFRIHTPKKFPIPVDTA